MALGFAGRSGLEAALRDLDSRWDTGPYGAAARTLIADHAQGLVQRLEDFDDLVREVSGANGHLVVSHGEPHPRT